MKKLFGVVAVVCLAVCAHAQNWTTVSASNITDLNQQKLAAGRLCFLITDLNDNPISVMIGGGGQSLQRPYCSTVINGAVTSFTVPNPANTSPANIAYRVTGTDSSTGQMVLRYTGVQFTGTTFNFDSYVPGFNLPLGASANVLSVGNLTVTGSCSYSGISGCGGSGGGGATLETNGTNNANQTVLNFQNGSTINGVQIQPSNPSGGNEQMAISGTLTVPGGGTGLATLTAHELYVGNGTSNPNPVATGNAGQVLISNGASSDPTFQDPIVSYNYSTLLNAASATATQNGTARVSKLSAYGTLYVTFASVSGTYTSCTIQLANVDNLGNAINDGLAISITPANGTTSYEITPAAGLRTTDQLKAIWACSAYGSAGTITAVYSPGDAVGIIGTPAVAQSGTWTVQPGNTANTTPWLATINQGGNSATVTASNALKVDGSAVTQSVSGAVTANAGTGTFNIQSNASVNVNQVGGSSVSTAATGTQLVGIADGAGNKLTSNSTSSTGKFGLDANILSILGTSPTTAGKLDVKGADGDVFVRQATASNLNATVVQSGTWTVQPGNTANTTPWLVQGNLSNNGAAAGANRIGTLGGIAQTDYNNGTAATQGRDVAPNVGTDGLLWTATLPAIRPASYHANANFAASSTTDNAVMPGNASNTVLVTKVTVSCTQTTAGIVLMKIIKRSTADTAGTSASMTAVPDDSNYAAAVSAPLSYTGTGPTVGTAVGNIDSYYLGCLAAGTATPNDIYVLNLRQKPIVLRGTAQQLAVNFNNAALTGGNLNVTFEWIETKTITP